MTEQGLKARLHIIAEETNIGFNECWKRLIFERFLTRLSLSRLSDKFVLKGGFLLSFLIKIGRETNDLDFSL